MFALELRSGLQGLEPAMFPQEGVFRLHRTHILGRHQVQAGREDDAGRIFRQDRPVARNPIHTAECMMPGKATAPKKCCNVERPKKARLSKAARCKHLTARLCHTQCQAVMTDEPGGRNCQWGLPIFGGAMCFLSLSGWLSRYTSPLLSIAVTKHPDKATHEKKVFNLWF